MENKYSRKYLIETGIGLQDVDNLKNSSYFINESERYIKGEITLEELDKIITSYYKNKPDDGERTREADQIAVKISDIISEDTFTFTVGQLVSIHKRLFEGIFPHAGKFRDYNFRKKEWVLDGASVWYGDYRELETTLEYDFAQEKKFDYSKLSNNEIIEHLSIFISNLWQIHPFEEGNTRTTAVFIIKYLRSLGYDVTNDVFAKNAWYFRNSLVRANYKHVGRKIAEDRTYLEKFLRNLLFEESNPLENRTLHISYKQQEPGENREIRLIKLLKAEPKIKVEEAAQLLGVSPRTIKATIKILEDKQMIKRVNGKRFGYWQILENGDD